jgi:hypothetical protein
MLKSACAALALLAAGPAFAQPAAVPSAAASSALLTVDSTLNELILNPRTRPVIVRDMPGFVERLESEPEVAQIFGGVRLSDLAADPHVKGMTPEVLAKIGAQLAEAQKAS